MNWTETMGTVFRVEVLQLLRDRRALFAAVLLPVVLYPLMLSGSDLLQKSAVSSLDKRELTVLVDASEAPPERAMRLIDAIQGPATIIQEGDASSLNQLPAASLPDTHRQQIEDAWRELIGDTAQAILTIAGGDGPNEQRHAKIWHERNDESSRTPPVHLRRRRHGRADALAV